MSEHYVVHRVFNGHDEVLGKFSVENGEIRFDSQADEYNCDLFPAGRINPRTASRLQSLLNNDHKSVYIVHG